MSPNVNFVKKKEMLAHRKMILKFLFNQVFHAYLSTEFLMLHWDKILAGSTLQS